MSHYKRLAAARFRQYKWDSCKAAVGESATTITFQMIQQVAPLLVRSGIIKRRNIEKVPVE